MSKSRTLYLDHASTSYPKPDAVGHAIHACMEEAGGNPGRGSHRLSLAASREVYRCREIAADTFGTSPERVIFTLNATHALNLAIKGVMRRGGHALCSDLEHNAVLRPVTRLAEEGFARKTATEGQGSLYSLLKEQCAEHYHLVCTDCGALSHLSCDHIEAFIHHISMEHGFTVSPIKTTLYGLCAECKRAKKRKEAL